MDIRDASIEGLTFTSEGTTARYGACKVSVEPEPAHRFAPSADSY